MRSPTGRPAYDNPGIVSTHKDVTHAMAIPTGPQRSPARKNDAVTVMSTTPQRKQRSARPIDR